MSTLIIFSILSFIVLCGIANTLIKINKTLTDIYNKITSTNETSQLGKDI